jgi:branched-chain amino acid transport system ATP-binding protein
MSPILSVRNLSRNFGAIKAVDDVSFDLAKGELLALIGPNGAGKSTCFNMLMGQLKPSSGTVQLMGRTSRACNRARSGAWGWGGRSRSPRPMPR